MSLAAPAIARDTYSPEAYTEELGKASENRTVGHEVLFENERVRIWGLDLAPGERVPFHSHTSTYFWVCTDEGRAQQRYPSGEIDTFDFRAGDVDFLEIAPGESLIHDLDNCGDTRLRFIAVELLGDRASS
jgi:beta-alanine degradation protein BauB